MSKINTELTAKIKQNREYVKQAQKALAEVRRTIQRSRSGFHVEAPDLPPAGVGLPVKNQAADDGNFGRFVSSRNGKGWLKKMV